MLRVLCAVTAVLSVESAAMPTFDAQGPNPPGAPVFGLRASARKAPVEVLGTDSVQRPMED
jgi:hypothetical protein